MRHTSISSEDAQIEYGKLTIQFSICCEVAGASVSVAPYALPTSSVPHGPDKSEAHFDPEEGFAHLLADRKCRSGVCMQRTVLRWCQLSEGIDQRRLPNRADVPSRHDPVPIGSKSHARREAPSSSPRRFL